MKIDDILWAGAWFIAGLITFQVTSIKKLLNTASIIITVLSIITAIFKPDDLVKFILSQPVSYIAGTITNLLYLIGANIVRGDQFDTDILWERIILYATLIIIFLIVIQELAPITQSV